MDLELSEDQRALVDAARDYLVKRCPPELIRQLQDGAPDLEGELWRELCEQGWLGMAFPERHGGGGASLFELGLFCEQAGRVLLPGPFAAAVHAGQLITELGTPTQVESLLPRLITGELLITAAITESGVHHDLRRLATVCAAAAPGWTLSGEKRLVPGAGYANQLIVVAGTPDGGMAAALVPVTAEGVTLREHVTIGRDRQGEVGLRNVRLDDAALLGATTDPARVHAALARAEEVAIALSAMEMVGGARRVLEMTVEYVSGRRQFDRPIGSFQAVQHHAADMAIAVHGAGLAALQALWLVSERLPADRELAIAKATANEAYVGVTLTAHQLHGGMGITREHDLHLWSQHARATSLRLGTTHHQLTRLAARIAAPARSPRAPDQERGEPHA